VREGEKVCERERERVIRLNHSPRPIRRLLEGTELLNPCILYRAVEASYEVLKCTCGYRGSLRVRVVSRDWS
jgi:hypothetical protein